MASRLVDLSHAIRHGMQTYPGLPAPAVGAFRTHEQSRPHYAPGTEFHIGRIEMVTNTGTYLDAPFHRFRDAADLSGLPLESLADLPGLVVTPARADRIATPADLPDADLRGRAVLFHTGWSRHFGTQRYFDDHPYLETEVADALVRRGAALVGIDSLNIDATRTGARPVHTALLGAGIPIVEHLTHLDALPAQGFRFFAVPVKVEGLGSFPVRAFAIVDEPAEEARAARRRAA